MSTQHVPLFAHFTTGIATLRGDLGPSNVQDAVDLVAPRGPLVVTATAEWGDWMPRLTHFNADGQAAPREATGVAYADRVRIAHEDRSGWPGEISVGSASGLYRTNAYRLEVTGTPGSDSDIRRYVEDAIGTIADRYLELGYAAVPELSSMLTASGFDAEHYSSLYTGVVRFGDPREIRPGAIVRPSAWLYAIDVYGADPFRSVRVTATPEAGTDADMIVYMATASGRAIAFNQAGGGAEEVARIDLDSVGDRVYILIEEAGARPAEFRVRIDPDVESVVPQQTGADGFIARMRGLGGAAEYDQATLSAVLSFHSTSPWQRVYSRSDWGGENYWFQSSVGEVWSLWHGGAVHDRGGGTHLWTLTNLTEAVGLPSGMQPGSLSGTITSWRAFNVVGVDAMGSLVTYWWSPESGERQWGTRGNGWSLTNISEAATWIDGGRQGLSGATEVRRVARTTGDAERLEILATANNETRQPYMFWFDASFPTLGWRVALT